MHSAEFKLKIITPMFMAGADVRTPELKPPEFKGMMRFWWWAIRAEMNIENLRKEEVEIFGGTGEDAGIGYLLYSTILPQQEKEYIKTDFQFNIKLSSYYETSFKDAIASLWATIYLGGFGTRARRGAGNLFVEESTMKNHLLEKQGDRA